MIFEKEDYYIREMNIPLYEPKQRGGENMKNTTIALLGLLVGVVLVLIYLFTPRAAGAVTWCHNIHSNPCVESFVQCTNKVNSQGWDWGHCPVVTPTPTPTRTPSPTPTARPEVWCHYHWFGCHEDQRRHCDDGWSNGRCPTASPTSTPSATPVSTPEVVDAFTCEMDHSCKEVPSVPACGQVQAPTIKYATAHRLGTNAVVNYWPTVPFGTVNIRYKEVGASGWNHALRDFPNLGIAPIGFLKDGVKYEYQLTNGYDCGQSNWSEVFKFL